MSKRGIRGLSFSWRRAVGISGWLYRFSRRTGIPTTRSGRQRKLGRWMGMKWRSVLHIGGSTLVIEAEEVDVTDGPYRRLLRGAITYTLDGRVISREEARRLIQQEVSK